MFARWTLVFVVVIAVAGLPGPAHAQRLVPEPVFSVPLRDVGIVSVPIGGLAILGGAGLLLGTAPVCVFCAAHPEWLVPGVVTLIIGLVHVAFGIPAIAIGNHRVHGPTMSLGPSGMGVAF